LTAPPSITASFTDDGAAAPSVDNDGLPLPGGAKQAQHLAFDPLAVLNPNEDAPPTWTQHCFGMDLGGTLCKLVYFEKAVQPRETDAVKQFRIKMRKLIDDPATYGQTGLRDVDFEFDSKRLGGHVYFAQFETRKMLDVIAMVREHQVVSSTTPVCATGGGARKYSEKIKEVLGITISHCDELQSLILGINFLVKQDNTEAYKVNHKTFEADGIRHYVGLTRAAFPYLLVNIGSGVSILKVYRDGKHERVGGTSLGGATFFGLCCMLTGCSTFQEALQLAESGNAQNIDLLVEDIYGGDYDEFNLPGSTVASSLGKLVLPEVREKADKRDLARAVLEAITNNVGALANLHAHAQNTQEIIFAGNFLRNNKISKARLAYAMGYWSKGKRHAMFLRHEGYLGAFGALLNQLGLFDTPATSPQRCASPAPPPHPSGPSKHPTDSLQALQDRLAAADVGSSTPGPTATASAESTAMLESGNVSECDQTTPVPDDTGGAQ